MTREDIIDGLGVISRKRGEMVGIGDVIVLVAAIQMLKHSPEGDAHHVVVSKELLRHAQRKCSDLGVQLAIHNVLADSEPQPQIRPSDGDR